MRKILFAIIFCFISVIQGCTGSGAGESAEEQLDSFACNFINYNLKGCMPYVTDESKPMLQFLASNMTRKDVDKLRSMLDGATYEMDDMEEVDDSHSVGHIIAHDMLVLGQFGDTATIEKEVSIEIPLVKNGSKWLVEMDRMPRMAVLLQSGTQSPD